MNENDNQNKNQHITRKRYVISILVALLVGVLGTLSVNNFLEEPSEDVVNDTPSEEIAETELDTQYLLGDADELSIIDKLYAILMTTYYEEVDSEVLVEGALEGMAGAVGDPYTEYLDAAESTSFAEDISGSFQGIGAEVMKDGEYVRIVSPIANSPAEEAGLQPNDLIVEVDGESIAELSLNEGFNSWSRRYRC
mgnify:CR=1 FL=1